MITSSPVELKDNLLDNNEWVGHFEGDFRTLRFALAKLPPKANLLKKLYLFKRPAASARDALADATDW